MFDKIASVKENDPLIQLLKAHSNSDSKPNGVGKEPISKAPAARITDMAFLNSFTGGNREKIAKYVNMFLQICPGQLEAMTKHLATGNYDQLEGAAHALKPQITYMGIRSGEDLIKKIEKFAEEKHEVEKLPSMLDEFRTICNNAMPELKEEINK